MHDPPAANLPPESSPLSLGRLREAFAAMLGEGGEQGAASKEQGAGHKELDDVPTLSSPLLAPRSDDCEVNPRSLVEAMLFVGRPNRGAFSSRELAAAMRGVSPGEVDEAVAELNAIYRQDAAPYEIVDSGEGYRLLLRDEFARLRDKFHGRVREGKLSPAAREVLAVVAYSQPTTVEQINELRGAASGALLAGLVRRQLVRVNRSSERGSKPQYSTTERFLRLFGLSSLSDLPRSEELEAA